MAGTDKWIWGGLVGVFGLIGLFVASNAAAGSVGYWGGLAFGTFAVLFIFFLVKQAMDRAERH
jgi:hypothetical protein